VDNSYIIANIFHSADAKCASVLGQAKRKHCDGSAEH